MKTANGLDKFRVGQNRIYTPYMTVYLVVFLPKIPYIYRIYMVLANSRYIGRLHSVHDVCEAVCVPALFMIHPSFTATCAELF